MRKFASVLLIACSSFYSTTVQATEEWENMVDDQDFNNKEAAQVIDADFQNIPLTLLNQSKAGYYTAEFYFGSNSQGATLSIDTSSAQVAVSSELCTNSCSSKAYIPGTSSSVIDIGIRYELDYDFDNQNFKTIQFQDSLCYDQYDKWSCAANFPFFVIYDAENMFPDIDGVFGLGTTAAGGPSYIEYLYNSEIIDSKLFAMYLHDQEPANPYDQTLKHIQYGSYDPALVVNGDAGINWMRNPVKDAEDWYVELTAATFGDKKLFAYQTHNAVLHAGTPMIGIPDEHFTKISTYIRAEKKFVCDNSRCRSRQECSEIDFGYQNLELSLGNDFDATITGKELLIEIGEEHRLRQENGYSRPSMEDFKCMLAVFNAGDQYILGNPFLKNFYAIYDMDNQSVGLGAVKIIPAPVVVPEPVAEDPVIEDDDSVEDATATDGVDSDVKDADDVVPNQVDPMPEGGKVPDSSDQEPESRTQEAEDYVKANFWSCMIVLAAVSGVLMAFICCIRIKRKHAREEMENISQSMLVPDDSTVQDRSDPDMEDRRRQRMFNVKNRASISSTLSEDQPNIQVDN